MDEAIKIDKVELQKALKELDKVANRFADTEWRRATMQKASTTVVISAKGIAMNKGLKSKKVHYYYRLKQGKIKSGDNLKERIAIHPGNLINSLMYLNKTKRLKTPNAVIGPKIKRRITSKNIGRNPGNSSGYYAAMAKNYKSREDFRRDIMEPALAAQRKTVLIIVSGEIEKRRKATTIQLSFWK